MKELKVKCPAKINLTLEVLDKRGDGFHNIKSIMQMISLYDYLTIKVEASEKLQINLSGTSTELPYDDKNLVYKAARHFCDVAGINNYSISIHIEKNIPIAAGLAGGSTDAAGTIWGLNRIFSNMFTEASLHKMCARLGSDLNVCLSGGCELATSRGEAVKRLPSAKYDLTLIKPKNVGITAKEAYTKYSLKRNKPKTNRTENMMIALLDGASIKPYLYNDLELAVFNDYEELKQIKSHYPEAVMSGSGSTYFVLENLAQNTLGEDYEFINGLHFVDEGVSEY